MFRSLLIAAAMKAPDDPSKAAKQVWDAYYRNHQINGKFKHLKVADIFMGGGTTIVEGSRLGMQMYGNDYNPVAWFVVKNEMAKVDRAELEKALADIEAEVKPQIMPFYACNCPRGHKGKWARIADGQVMGDDFDPLALSPEERKLYSYHGPETISVFWAKHGPCQVRGCGHRTPLMSSPGMVEKELTVKYWKRKCSHCDGEYDIEAGEPRMAPGVPLVWSEGEKRATPGRFDGREYPAGAACPHCGNAQGRTDAWEQSGKTAPVAMYAIQGYCPECDREKQPYGGRFFIPASDTVFYDKAYAEWEARKNCDLKGWWPENEIPFGHTTNQRDPLDRHGYGCYWKMFNSRQLLSLSLLLRAIGSGDHSHQVREYILEPVVTRF